MLTESILDLCTIAQEWRDTLEESPADRDGELIAACVDLCDELGCDATPDDLMALGNDYEPTMIREDYFTEYARELAEDIGAIDSDAGWPAYCIDWERAARDLAADYMSVRFLGRDYLIPSW